MPSRQLLPAGAAITREMTHAFRQNDPPAPARQARFLISPAARAVFSLPQERMAKFLNTYLYRGYVGMGKLQIFRQEIRADMATFPSTSEKVERTPKFEVWSRSTLIAGRPKRKRQ
jgi:hypothetical protein